MTLLTFEPSGAARARIDAIVASPAFARAVAVLAREHERTVAEIIELTQIPAPSGAEGARARAYLEKLRAHGLDEVELDAAGNATGLRRGSGNGQVIVLAAHLDTVFPAGTDVTVRRDGTRLMAPGIGDDTRSLAMLLALLRAMDEAKIRTRADLLFVGDVAEETDLEGSRHLVGGGRYKERIGAFVTLDGTEPECLTIQGVGARTYRVTMTGPGGHAYGAFGVPNPAVALGKAMAAFGDLPMTVEPRTSCNIGRIGGGTAANAIPELVYADFEFRAPDRARLLALDEAFQELVARAVATVNERAPAGLGRIEAGLELREDIPGGTTDAGSDLVQAAAASILAHGYRLALEPAITDANSAMAAGIPAIKLAAGGPGGGAHTLDEWIDVEPKEHLRGMRMALAAILAVAGAEALD